MSILVYFIHEILFHFFIEPNQPTLYSQSNSKHIQLLYFFIKILHTNNIHNYSFTNQIIHSSLLNSHIPIHILIYIQIILTINLNLSHSRDLHITLSSFPQSLHSIIILIPIQYQIFEYLEYLSIFLSILFLIILRQKLVQIYLFIINFRGSPVFAY